MPGRRSERLGNREWQPAMFGEWGLVLQSGNTDMIDGSIFKSIFWFSIPLLNRKFFQQLHNTWIPMWQEILSIQTPWRRWGLRPLSSICWRDSSWDCPLPWGLTDSSSRRSIKKRRLFSIYAQQEVKKSKHEKNFRKSQIILTKVFKRVI